MAEQSQRSTRAGERPPDPSAETVAGTLRCVVALAGEPGPPPDAFVLARGLYRATLDHLRRSANPAAERHLLLVPLSAALAIQRTRDGVACCAALNAALARGDHEAALDACVALVDIAMGVPRNDETPVGG